MGLQEAMLKAVAVIYAGRQRRLFSKRRAAKLLGVDRSTTLERMIQNGEIGTVRVNGRVMVPAAELERVCVPSNLRQRFGATRQPTSVRPSKNPGAATRARPF